MKIFTSKILLVVKKVNFDPWNICTSYIKKQRAVTNDLHEWPTFPLAHDRTNWNKITLVQKTAKQTQNFDQKQLQNPTSKIYKSKSFTYVHQVPHHTTSIVTCHNQGGSADKGICDNNYSVHAAAKKLKLIICHSKT
jgi:hypothetical protein